MRLHLPEGFPILPQERELTAPHRPEPSVQRRMTTERQTASDDLPLYTWLRLAD
ncbi:MAG: hypothetical protein R6X15_09935 [Pseudomonadota bacterium]